MARQVIREALELIERTEKCSLTAYQGAADKPGILTIGRGHVLRPGDPHTITQAQADAMFAQDVADHARFIQADVGIGVSLNDYEYGALASFCFNLGQRILQSAPSVTIPLRAGDPKGIFNLYKFSNSDGKYRDGLFYRRLTEIALAIAHRLVAKPDNCIQAKALMTDLEAPQAMFDYFNKHHREDLCNVCKHSH